MSADCRHLGKESWLSSHEERHSTHLGRVGKRRAFLNLALRKRAQEGKQWACEVCGVEKWCPWLVNHSAVVLLFWMPFVLCPMSTMLKMGAHIMGSLLAMLQNGPCDKNVSVSQ